MPDLIRHPVKFILDSGFRRKDNIDIYYCRSNNQPVHCLNTCFLKGSSTKVKEERGQKKGGQAFLVVVLLLRQLNISNVMPVPDRSPG